MKNLCLRSVVPKKYVYDKFNSFKEEVDAIIYGALESTVFSAKTLCDLQRSISKFATSLHGMKGLEVKEERQLNIWMNDMLEPIISSNRFLVKKKIST